MTRIRVLEGTDTQLPSCRVVILDLPLPVGMAKPPPHVTLVFEHRETAAEMMRMIAVAVRDFLARQANTVTTPSALPPEVLGDHEVT